MGGGEPYVVLSHGNRENQQEQQQEQQQEEVGEEGEEERTTLSSDEFVVVNSQSPTLMNSSTLMVSTLIPTDDIQVWALSLSLSFSLSCLPTCGQLFVLFLLVLII